MNTFNAEVNKIILAFTSVGILILLMFPVSLSANHFRYGTISWEPTADNGTHVTVRVKMQNGWTANHGSFRESSDYNTFVSGFVGSIKNNLITIYWGDGTTKNVDIKIISRENTTGTASSDCTSSSSQTSGKCIDSTISEMGEYSSGTWTTGVTHSYPDNGTTEYFLNWGGWARTSTNNNPNEARQHGGEWRSQTKINIGGTYDGNKSPVGAVPPIVQAQDNKEFKYQLVATDADGDSLNYRWGKLNEFFLDPGNNGAGPSSTNYFTKPPGMTLGSSGLIEWDIRDITTAAGGAWTMDNASEGSLWTSVVMVEDLDTNGSVKSYIPIDFFFKISSASNDPPEIFGLPTTTKTVTVGTTKTFVITSTDDSGVAPTVSILNPPSDESSIWNTTTSTAGSITTFTINFSPVSSMDNSTYAVNIRSTDNLGMTLDQSLGLKVTSVSNADPTPPRLLSPADNSTVTEPVTFKWIKSTDSDGDTVSYKIYICTNSSFTGCSGTSVTAGVNFILPFNQNFNDSLLSWASPLHAATGSQQISQDLSMIPKWVIMLGVFGLLSGFISLSVKNITHRRIVFMFIFLTICLSLTIISCSEKDEYESWEKKGYTPQELTYTTSDLTTNTTYYWNVIASDTRGGSAESETRSFKVK